MPNINVQVPAGASKFQDQVGTVFVVPSQTRSGRLEIRARLEAVDVNFDGSGALVLHISDEWEASVAMVELNHNHGLIASADLAHCAMGPHANCSETIVAVRCPHSGRRSHICTTAVEAGAVPWVDLCITTARFVRTVENLATWEDHVPSDWLDTVDATLGFYDKLTLNLMMDTMSLMAGDPEDTEVTLP